MPLWLLARDHGHFALSPQIRFPLSSSLVLCGLGVFPSALAVFVSMFALLTRLLSLVRFGATYDKTSFNGARQGEWQSHSWQRGCQTAFSATMRAKG